jgi:hypothetical protein
MLWFEVNINDKQIARVEMLNIKGKVDGVCFYNVKVWNTEKKHHYLQYEFVVEHNRGMGCWKLIEIVAKTIYDLDTLDGETSK